MDLTELPERSGAVLSLTLLRALHLRQQSVSGRFGKQRLHMACALACIGISGLAY